jgi:hypothetical protein
MPSSNELPLVSVLSLGKQKVDAFVDISGGQGVLSNVNYYGCLL